MTCRVYEKELLINPPALSISKGSIELPAGQTPRDSLVPKAVAQLTRSAPTPNSSVTSTSFCGVVHAFPVCRGGHPSWTRPDGLPGVQASATRALAPRASLSPIIIVSADLGSRAQLRVRFSGGSVACGAENSNSAYELRMADCNASALDGCQMGELQPRLDCAGQHRVSQLVLQR
ncbi:hypothetical protein NM208_g8965 [Fusarium decemcellulare]|uniref:Uncharacterized protein n=1 Tax=Fusarium decemcellulare TaxID=57161 RepID=A0ACC1S3J5_9HYPO|nr:hypothetical protein NM208_g8965 [Fusarium decemcellulare]